MRKVVLPKGMIELFKNLGSVIFTKRKAFYYFPFWISVDEQTGETQIYGLDELPQEVIESIASIREKIDADVER